MRRPLFFYIPLSEKILFVKHLSVMVKAGMTLVDSLVLLKKQMRSRSFSYVLEQVVWDVQNGRFLSESFRKFDNVFDQLFVNVIKIGEETGTLADNLLYLANELKKKQQLRQKVRGALIYPLVILLATFGVTGVLVFFILPKLIPVFLSLRVKLPLSTQILIGASKFLVTYVGYIVIGLIVAAIIFALLMRVTFVRLMVDKMILFLPLIGPLTKMANIADFTRTLGLLLKSGTRIVEAMAIVADNATSLVYRRAFIDAEEAVRRGEALQEYLGKHEHLFFPTVTRMIEVGNMTGTLESNLAYLTEFYENEIDEMTQNLSTVLEPVLLLIMGLVVGFVAISIITPIYEITQTFRR